ncbi:uncharacterized protein LOC131066091 [Cryptomeria japonica]|uniref:uncharacterized protein LOC131066091 n=1 Tax=Cryptomeria japonica TaxID=3369 RepID=UPI0025AB74B2|nr:uncharacterized protein LOC131066091 [Cryptomeria japonica]
MKFHLKSLGYEVWSVVENAYTKTTPPTTPDEKKAYESDAKNSNAICCGLTNDVLVKVMDCKNAKSIWDKLSSIYEGDEKVKEAKLQAYRAKFESLKMCNEEKNIDYFLRVRDVNYIHDERDVKHVTFDALHDIFTAYEMRISNDPPSKEITFKYVKIDANFDSEKLEDNESIFVSKLRRVSSRYKGKLPFKYFGCGKIGHYVAQFPNKDIYNVTNNYTDEALKEGEETRFMAIITSNESREIINSDHFESEIGIEGELKASLKEIKRLRKEATLQKDKTQRDVEFISDLKHQIKDNKKILELTQETPNHKEIECCYLEA